MHFNSDTCYQLLHQIQGFQAFLEEQGLKNRLQLETFFYTTQNHRHRDWYQSPALEEYRELVTSHDIKTRHSKIIDFALSILKHCPKPVYTPQKSRPSAPSQPVTKSKTMPQGIVNDPKTNHLSKSTIDFIKQLCEAYFQVHELATNLQHEIQSSCQLFKLNTPSYSNQLALEIHQLYIYLKESAESLEKLPFQTSELQSLIQLTQKERKELTVFYILQHHKFEAKEHLHFQMSEMHVETWKEWQCLPHSEKQAYFKQNHSLYSSWSDHIDQLPKQVDQLIHLTYRIQRFLHEHQAMSFYYIQHLKHLSTLLKQIFLQLKTIGMDLKQKFNHLQVLIKDILEQPSPLKNLTLSLPKIYSEAIHKIQMAIPSILSLNSRAKFHKLSKVIEGILEKIGLYIQKPENGFLKPNELLERVKKYFSQVISTTLVITQS